MANQGRITLARLAEIKQSGRKFSVLTCYDAATARLMAGAGVEVLLVGDTAAEVVLDLASTRDIQPEVLIALTAAVRRGAPEACVLADLPYACRSGGVEATVNWVGRFRDETGADAVKIEVTGQDVDLVARCRDAGVSVVAHLGLLPQQIDSAEGYRAQARDAESARALIVDARRMEEAGADMLLLEAVASEVAREIASQATVPVIGCVCGPHCDGTVVVLHDLLGLGGGHPPRGVQRYGRVLEEMIGAFRQYVSDIHTGAFPRDQDAPHMKPGELDKLMTAIGGR